MKILMISNSFGVNLQTYACQIAEENGYDLDIYVLYIGGCSLETHWNNILSKEKAYELFVNGASTHKMVSIHEALHMDEWDYISLQQASHLSGYLPSYYPFFDNVYSYVKKECHNSKIMFHKTWAYSSKYPDKYISTKEMVNNFSFSNEEEMKQGIDHCVNNIKEKYQIDLLIDSGSLVFESNKVFDDIYDNEGFHMSFVGSYLIGLNLIFNLFQKVSKPYYPENLKKSECDSLFEYLKLYLHK